MGKRNPLSFLMLVMTLVAGLGAGMLVQAKVQTVLVQAGADSNALVSDLTMSLEKSTSALERTTAERNRLLEHLADVESADCIPIMVWACPAKGGEQ